MEKTARFGTQWRLGRDSTRRVRTVLWAGVGVLTVGVASATSLNEPVKSLIAPDPLVISVNAHDAGGITMHGDESAIRWSCHINLADPTLCRGRADGARTTLEYFDQPPVTFTNKDLMLYQSRGRLVGVQVGYRANTAQEMDDTFSRLIENRYDAATDADLRACGRNTASAAIESAVANYNEPHSSICADRGGIRIIWRFAVYMDSPDPNHRLLKLTIRAPGMEGPDSWWF